MKIFALLTVTFLCMTSCSFTSPSHPPRHHSIDYVEITVTDMKRAQSFYSGAFEWKFTNYGPDYAGVRGESREVGGLSVANPRPRGGPLVILYSDDLEATLAAVRSAGGTILKEPFAFPGGRRFHFADPSGNELAVWALK